MRICYPALLAIAVLFSLSPVSAQPVERPDAQASPQSKPSIKAIGLEKIIAADHLGANRHALIIGINDYADAKIPDLKFAEADAQLLYNTLTDTQVGGFKKNSVTLLTGKQATSREVRKALSALRGVGEEDLVVVFFSGHGAKQRGETCWVTQDAEIDFLADTALTNDQLKKYLDAIPSKRLVTFIDACYAADTVINQKAVVDVSEVAKAFTGAGRVTIASASGGQESIEAADLKQGIFTYFLVQGLKGAADSNSDGVQTLDEVWAYLNGSVAQEARKRQGIQVPTKHSLAETQSDKFLLTIDADRFARSVQERAALKALRDKYLALLEKLYLDEVMDKDSAIEGRKLLMADDRTLDINEKRRLALFVQMLEGNLKPDKLRKMLDLLPIRNEPMPSDALRPPLAPRPVVHETIARLWATALANDNRDSGRQALAALDELLKLDPNHAKAAQLKRKILHYMEPAVLDLGGGIKLATVFIPSGRFDMGSPASEIGREFHETQRSITVANPFYLGETEVTQAQWKAIMGTTPWKELRHIKEGDEYPATQVSWNDAQAFIKALSAKSTLKARLPTEAEWEYACRAGTTTVFSFGDSERNLSDHAWWGGAIGGGSARNELYAHKVKTKKPNPWGLYDMHGNVHEWCEDRYNASTRVLRGGGWGLPSKHCRSAARYWGDPDGRANDRGFRVVIEIQD